MPTSFLSLVKRFAREERGASLVEYAVLIGMITALVVTAITGLGSQIILEFNEIVGELAGNAG
jgi:pilus assembly protein Flp/PilA